MAHNRAQLNALIFHNEVVLPRTSPGFAEVTLAVAELQGGNNAKAALYAESAVLRDPALAAAWLAKTAADVFEATPDDLRKERALFCMDRALECVPACRQEIVEFFVANILGHYVEVLCTKALGELAQWLDLEAEADELEDRALELRWQASQMRARATLLEAAGLVTGLIAMFSRRLGTQVFSGVASVAAFSEAASSTRNAALLDAMGGQMRAAGGARRREGSGHRAASMLYLVPARDLIDLATQLLQAEGLPTQSFDRLTQAFSGSLRQVLGSQLQGLHREVGGSLLAAIQGDATLLEISYWGAASKSVKGQALAKVHEGLRPVSRATLLWLEQMLPGVKSIDAYQLLASPLSFVAARVYGLRDTFAERALVKRIHKAHAMAKLGGAGCLAVLAFGLLFVCPPVALLIGVGAIGYAVHDGRLRRRHRWAEELLASLWSADTWLMHPAIDLFHENQAVGAHGPNAQLALPSSGGVWGRLVARISPSNRLLLFVVGSLVLWCLSMVAFMRFLGSGDTASTTQPPAAPSTSVAGATNSIGAPKPTPPTVRRAAPVSGRAAASSPVQTTGASPASSPTEGALYTVVGVPDGDTLNARAGPGINHGVVARLSRGTNHLRVTGAAVMNEKTAWVPVQFGERTGWVTKAHLQRE